jgi:putrescine transport system substrate-binding protein
MWFDQMAIPADAKNVEEAHAFINYMMKPEVAAKASNYVFYANGNKASQPLHRQGIIDDPGDLSGRSDDGEAVHRGRYDPRRSASSPAWTKVTTGQ